LNRILLENCALLDPRSSELKGGHSVFVEAGVIREVSGRPIRINADAVIDVGGKTLMPGLIDLHVHVTATQYNVPAQVSMPNVFVTLRTLPIMQGMLQRGFTSVRDAAGAEFALAQAVESGLVEGPRLFVSGHGLSQTGGHGDLRMRTDFLPAHEICACGFRVGTFTRVVDGVDAVRKAVREELQMGAHQIKIMASGGVASPTDPVDALGYSLDEIRAAVGEATARNTYVMAHAYTPAAIKRAVQCGVRTIEHGNLVDREAAEVMRAHGAYAVPTLVTYDALAGEGARLGLLPSSVEKAKYIREAGVESLKIWRDAGVKIGFGTDLLGESHRLQSDEFRIRAEVLPPGEIIASATTVAAEILGMDGKLGVIEPGAIADMLVVDGNPLRDLNCLLGQGEHLDLIMKDGKLYKNRLAP
jgi:imidazolonepropionase-like amidohydrolase